MLRQGRRHHLTKYITWPIPISQFFRKSGKSETVFDGNRIEGTHFTK